MIRRIAILAAGAAVLVGLLAASLVRIPAGQMGAASRGWLQPGWHLRAPLSRVARIPGSASLELNPVEAVTAAGATRKLSVRLRYTIGKEADPALAAATRRQGFAAALLPLLAEGAGAGLRSNAGRLSRSGTAADPLGSALVASLRQRGIAAEDLAWDRADEETGPPVLPSSTGPRRKILVVGLDAADWQIVDPLLQQGRLPHLARLIEGGARAPLRSYDPMISPLIWTTMVTGVGPETHGVADFTITDGATGRQIPITSRFRKVKALWNILSDAQIPSGFIGWWASYPAEEVRGYLVTDLLGFSMMRPGAPDRAGMQAVTYPETYYAEIRPKLILPDAVSYEEVSRFLHVSRSEFERAVDVQPRPAPVPGEPPVVQNPIWLVRRTLAVTRNYATIALDLLGRNVDVVGVYFEGIDMMGHRFQHCLPPRMDLCSEDDYAKFQDAVTAFYAYQDEVLGRLLEAAPGRTVMIVSDHGFRTGSDRPPDYLPYTTGQPVEWHREYGLFVLSGPGSRRGARLESASVYDVAPTLLHLLGLPAGEDMPGRVLTEALSAADLSRERLARIPSYEDRGASRKIPQAVSSPEAQREMIESLQALGYVGAVGESSPPAAGGQAGGAPAREDGRVGERTAAEGGTAGSASERRGAPNEAAGGAGGTGPGVSQGKSPAGETTRVTYHRNLATFYMKQGRFAEAERQLLEANRIQPLPKTYEMLSEIRASQGDVTGAIRFLEDGLHAFVQMDQEAILWMMDLRLQQGRADLAAEILSAWRSRLVRPALLAACEGKLAAARGEEDRAIASFLEALRLEPALSQAALAAAPLLNARGRLKELQPAISRALASEKRIDEYQNLLGLIHLDARRPSQALDTIGKALDMAPANPRFLENYASAALAAGKPELALERYRAGMRDPRFAAPAWAGYGRLLGVSRRPREAATAFEKALAMGDTSPATYAGYATSLFQDGRRDRSREVLKEGLLAHPEDPALLALGRKLE